MDKLYSEEYEKTILGCMLLDNSIIDDVASIIKKEYFQIGKYILIFDNIVNLYNTHNSCDMIMLSQTLPKYAVDIADLTTEVVSVANYEFYANKIKELYTSRKTRQFFNEKSQSINDKNINDVLYEADDFINACMTDVSKVEPIDSKKFAISIIEDIQENAKRKGKLEGFDTGYEKLNELTGGLICGNTVVIGARPSIGKSAFSDQLNVNLAMNGVQTVTFSLEMTKKEIMRRRAAAFSNVPIRNIKSGLLSSAQGARINNFCQKLFDTDMLIYDSATIGFDFNELVARIRIHAKQGYKVFFIDHIGLLEYSDGTGLKDFEKMSQITKRLKKMAATLDIVIIEICQLTRDTEGKEPQLNSLRGSGSIEQDANIVMFLHGERQQNNELTLPRKLLVVKDRDGSCGEINFEFTPSTTKFQELTDSGDYVKKQAEVVQKSNEVKEEDYREEALF